MLKKLRKLKTVMTRNTFYDWIKEPYSNIYRVEQLHQQRTLKEIVNLARKTFIKRNYMFLTHLPE